MSNMSMWSDVKLPVKYCLIFFSFLQRCFYIAIFFLSPHLSVLVKLTILHTQCSCCAVCKSEHVHATNATQMCIDYHNTRIESQTVQPFKQSAQTLKLMAFYRIYFYVNSLNMGRASVTNIFSVYLDRHWKC